MGRRFYILLCCVVAMSILVGCITTTKTTQEPLQSAPIAQTRWTAKSIALPPGTDRPIKEGSTPLVYIVESACIIRVVDQTTNENLLTIPVTSRTIVSVNSRLGITLGNATMRAGPLSADHHYAIFLESNSRDNVIEQGTVRPGQAPQPNAPPELPPTAPP